MHRESNGEIFPSRIALKFGLKKSAVINIIKKMENAHKTKERQEKDGANTDVSTEFEEHNNPSSNFEGYVPTKHKFK